MQDEEKQIRNEPGKMPYEQERIVEHLESLIEDERINSIGLKEEYK